jgi:hypothetical protein
VLADGFALFSTQHAHLLPASALTAEALNAATAALAAQTAPTGDPLHQAARFLVVGPTIGAEARSLVVPNTPPTGAVEAGALTVLVEPRITDARWYVMAATGPIAHAYLRGVDGPALDSRDGWDVDGREYRAREDFGAVVTDYRTAVLTPAAP